MLVKWEPSYFIVILHKKWNFLLKISSVNVTESTVSFGFGHIYWRNPKWKTLIFVQLNDNQIPEAFQREYVDIFLKEDSKKYFKILIINSCIFVSS